jgi:hypothetical protein
MPPKSSSIRAYIDHVRNGGVKRQQDKIMACYLENDPVWLTRNQVEELTGIRINAVTGRVNILLYPDPDDHEIEGPLKVMDHGRCPVSQSERVELIGVNWIAYEKMSQLEFNL